MAEEYDWGPVVQHDGKGCDLAEGTYILAFAVYPGDGDIAARGQEVQAEGRLIKGSLEWDAMDWSNFGVRPMGLVGGYIQVPKILRYRIRRPRALTQLIELVETMPAQPQEVGV